MDTNSTLIIDGRMQDAQKKKLKELGYNLLELKPSNSVYEEISGHVDIFTCKIENKLIVEPSRYSEIKEKLYMYNNIEPGNSNLQSKYPNDIKYNVCIIGTKAIHNFEFCDTKIKQELIEQDYRLINTTQGYTNCSIAVIDENSAIVADKGLYKILQKHNIDTLYLQYEPDIKLINNNKYSTKKGFIGGVISRIDNYVIITGDLSKIDKNNQIRNFILKRNLEIIDFKDLDVIDYGGIVQLKL